jgi:hypothetical protein
MLTLLKPYSEISDHIGILKSISFTMYKLINKLANSLMYLVADIKMKFF